MVEEDDVRRFPGNEHDDVGQAEIVWVVVDGAVVQRRVDNGLFDAARIFAIERARIDDDLLSATAACENFWREIVQNIFWETEVGQMGFRFTGGGGFCAVDCLPVHIVTGEKKMTTGAADGKNAENDQRECAI